MQNLSELIDTICKYLQKNENITTVTIESSKTNIIIENKKDEKNQK